MDFGLQLPQTAGYDLATDVTGVARAAEAAGFAALWVYERVLYPVEPVDDMPGMPGMPWPDAYRSTADPLTVLSIAAGVTSSVRLGTSVLQAPLHPTLALARALATLDAVSGGRVVAGLGSGWSRDEYAAVGADFATRGQALEDTITGLRALWAADPVAWADGGGDVPRSLVSPKPARIPPIVVAGGQGRRARDRIARLADGWMPAALPPAALAEQWRELRDLAAAHGRDPDALRLVPRANVVVLDAPLDGDRTTYTGSFEQVVEDLVGTAAAGASEVSMGLRVTGGAAELLEVSVKLRDATLSAL